jgi:hypothetical protein
MLAGGDSIDDVAVLRAGAGASLFDGTRAPSTVGSWLRVDKWSNVRQLDAISRELLARLWAAGAGPVDLSAPLTIDLASTIVEVHGRHKQGAVFGYAKVRGYYPQLATCAQTGQVLMSRLRGGSTGAARGASAFLTGTISRVLNGGATGQLTVRAGSAFYSKVRRMPTGPYISRPPAAVADEGFVARIPGVVAPSWREGHDDVHRPPASTLRSAAGPEGGAPLTSGYGWLSRAGRGARRPGTRRCGR